MKSGIARAAAVLLLLLLPQQIEATNREANLGGNGRGVATDSAFGSASETLGPAAAQRSPQEYRDGGGVEGVVERCGRLSRQLKEALALPYTTCLALRQQLQAHSMQLSMELLGWMNVQFQADGGGVVEAVCCTIDRLFGRLSEPWTEWHEGVMHRILDQISVVLGEPEAGCVSRAAALQETARLLQLLLAGPATTLLVLAVLGPAALLMSLMACFCMVTVLLTGAAALLGLWTASAVAQLGLLLACLRVYIRPVRCLLSCVRRAAATATPAKPASEGAAAERTSADGWRLPAGRSVDGEQQVETCRICLEQGAAAAMVDPCGCRGSIRWVHAACLQQWMAKAGRRCGCCGCTYAHPRLPLPCHPCDRALSAGTVLAHLLARAAGF